MPIYEFKCLKCEQYIELLLMNSKEEVDLKCPECSSQELERIMSTTNYNVGNGSGKGQGVSTQTKTCSGGSCTTWDLPGHTR